MTLFRDRNSVDFLGFFMVLGVFDGVSRSLLSVELELATFWQVSVSFFSQSLNISMSCCYLEIKLQHFRQTREEQRAVFKRSNPKFDSWLQILSCFTLHNLLKSFTAMFTPVFRLHHEMFTAGLQWKFDHRFEFDAWCLWFDAAVSANNIRHK